MLKNKKKRIIIDTNIWISFLIGKELKYLKDLIVSEKIVLITTPQLLQEIKLVTSRRKLKKYFNSKSVNQLLSLLDIISEKFVLNEIEKISRDPKDDFLLALSKTSNADFLITGDRDLLDLKNFGTTQILPPSEFKSQVL